jgi:hypothetical protein
MRYKTASSMNTWVPVGTQASSDQPQSHIVSLDDSVWPKDYLTHFPNNQSAVWFHRTASISADQRNGVAAEERAIATRGVRESITFHLSIVFVFHDRDFFLSPFSLLVVHFLFHILIKFIPASP